MFEHLLIAAVVFLFTLCFAGKPFAVMLRGFSIRPMNWHVFIFAVFIASVAFYFLQR